MRRKNVKPAYCDFCQETKLECVMVRYRGQSPEPICLTCLAFAEAMEEDAEPVDRLRRVK